MTFRRRIGPHHERPHFVIARAFSEPPQLFSVHGQNHRSRRYHGRDLATGELTTFPMDDALAVHEDEAEARRCFADLCRQLPAIDAAVWRARRAAEDAELARRRAVREIAIGKALA